MKSKKLFFLIALLIAGLYLVGCGKKEGAKTGEMKMIEVPATYADKHMPQGGWTDEKVIAAGKELYDGKKNIDVNCAACHGLNGIPVLTGTRDLRDASRVNMWSDSYWYWRVAEGVPDTAMTGWKEKLSEEEIWQVIAYARTFSQKGK
ncbi:MAG: cytochrome c [Nitrospirae bacterium]|nr:cytochrome c [Nitrospirota bacterium]